MNLLGNELNVFCDCDETLILHTYEECHPPVDIMCPYENVILRFGIHAPHVKLLKDRKQRGSTIFVWSAGGHAWAKAVSEALGLEDVVDHYLSKPFMAIDDLPVGEGIGRWIYFDPLMPYGSDALYVKVDKT